MIDKDLYAALQEVDQHKSMGSSYLSPKSDHPEDRKAFNLLILALYKLRGLNFVEFRDSDVLKLNIEDNRYQGINCKLTYEGEKALSYGSYEAYQASLPTARPLAVNVDQSFKNYGSMNGSNIAVHSNQANQTLGRNSEIDKLCKEMIEILRRDMTLESIKRQDLLDDVETLKRELGKENPRPGMLSEIYSVLGNTASLVGILPQLQALVGDLLT